MSTASSAPLSTGTTALNLSEQWIQGINDADAKLNQSVQFCMSLPSYLLSSLSLPAVTNVRASEDNFPAEHNRWKVAYSSLMISALQLKLFFDVIWTTSTQPGNAYGVRSMDVELQSVISLLMAWPVGIGDGVNLTNSTLVARLCRNDGILLHTSTSVAPIESMLFDDTNLVATNHDGEVWFASSTLSAQLNSFSVLAVDRAHLLSFDDLFPCPALGDRFLAYAFDDSRVDAVSEPQLSVFDAHAQLNVSTDAKPMNNPTLGELSRFVCVSPN